MIDLPQTSAAIEAGIAKGEQPGAVLDVLRDGTTIAELAFGEARPGIPLSADQIVLWMSSCKPIGAAAMMQLVERGQIGLDDPVCSKLPEFAAGGKQAITVRHLLTHTGGFREVTFDPVEHSWSEIVDRICASPLEPGWISGETAGYHPSTSWFVLAELIRRVDGRPFSQYVRQELLLPLEMTNSWIGMPGDVYDRYGSQLVQTIDTSRTLRSIHKYSTPQGATVCVPGGNGHAPAREMARFYEMLRQQGELDGVRVLSAASVGQMTQRQREGKFDLTFRHKLDFGMGLIINSARYGAATVPYGYHPGASEDTFGHSGSQSSACYCDPQSGLVVCLAFTGMPGEAIHQRRIRTVLSALAADLKLSR